MWVLRSLQQCAQGYHTGVLVKNTQLVWCSGRRRLSLQRAYVYRVWEPCAQSMLFVFPRWLPAAGLTCPLTPFSIPNAALVAKGHKKPEKLKKGFKKLKRHEKKKGRFWGRPML